MFDERQMNDILKPPTGYRATDALFLTYSLNMKVLDSILTDCGLFRTYGNNANEAAEHVVCCFQRDRYISEQNGNGEEEITLGRLLNKEKRIIRKEPTFHPKLYVILFENKDENKQLLRLIIGSRNIARTNYFESMVCIEGTPSDNTVTMNEYLVDYIKRIAYNDAAKETVAKITDILSKTDFSEIIGKITGDTNAEYSFVRYPGDNNGADLKDLIIVSPFLGSWDFINKQINGTENWKIFTRDKVSENSLPKDKAGNPDNSNFFCMPSKIGESTDKNISDINELHAKIYAFKKDGKNHIYIGSANFSENGFGKNEELMLHIESESLDFADILDNALKDLFTAKPRISDEEQDSLPAGEALPEETASEEDIASQLTEHLEEYEAATFFSEITGKSVDQKKYAEDFVRMVSKQSFEDKENIRKKASAYETDSPMIKRYKKEITGEDK